MPASGPRRRSSAPRLRSLTATSPRLAPRREPARRSRAGAETRCHALELLGRVRRGNDLAAARDAFEQALMVAEEAKLAVWRLRALHELGTIDMFDHAGDGRLAQARRIADELGAASTGAVIDLQLTAVAMFRFELDRAERHARSGLAISTRLGLAQYAPSCSCSSVRCMRCGVMLRDGTLPRARQCRGAGDTEIEGARWLAHAACWRCSTTTGPGPGRPRARSCPARHAAAAGARALPALRPLLLAVRGMRERRLRSARPAPSAWPSTGSTGGCSATRTRSWPGATARIPGPPSWPATADRELRHYPVWADLARLCAAEAALAGKWGQPRPWLENAAHTLAGTGSSRWSCAAAACCSNRSPAAGPGWGSPAGRLTSCA